MAIIYTYPEINQVEGEDLLLISDTSLHKRPTRSVTVDDLALYIGIGFWKLGTAPDSIFTTKMTSVGQDANIANSKFNVYKTEDMVTSVPHVATFNESSSNHSANLWPSPGDNSADIYGSVSRATFTGSGTVDQIIGSNPIGRHSGSGNVNFIQGAQTTASLTGSGSTDAIIASYNKTFIEGTGSNNISTAIGSWNVAELNGLNDVDNIYGTYSNVVLTRGDVNDDAIGHFIDFDQVSADTEVNNAYYIHAKNDSLSVTGEKFFIKDETGIPSQFSNKLVLNAYGSGTFTGTATQRLAVDTSGNVIEIPIGSGPVDGSGTANYTARWIDTDTLGIGTLYDNGTNVGIGTTSPSSKLEIAGIGNQKLLVNRTNGDNFFIDAQNGQIRLRGSSNIYMGISGDLLTITNTNVGIGTTSPSSKFQVSVNDGDGITLKHGASNAFYILRDGSDDTIIKQTRNYTSKISISTLADSGTHESSGLNIVGQGIGLKSNVGIGTASPSHKLEVSGNSLVTGTQFIGDTFTKIQQASGNLLLTNQSLSGAIAFLTNSTEQVRITSTGNVGIGITNPIAPLHIESADDAVLRLKSTDNRAYIALSDNDTNSYISSENSRLSLGANPGVNANNLNIDLSSNNVGIGTSSPSVKLHISESAAASTANLLYLENTGSGGSEGVSIKFNPMFGATSMIASNREGAEAGKTNLTFHNCLVNDAAPIERMRITSAGNVGVGTTSPSEKLEVSGNVKVSSGSDNISITPNNINGSISTTSQSVQGAIISAVSDGLTFSSRNIYSGVNIGSFNNAGTVTLGAFGYGNVNYQTAHNSFAHTWYGSRASDPWMTLNSTGLGIGTTSPSEKLHVFGGAAAIEIDSTTNEASLKYDNSTTTANIKLANNDLKTELGGTEVMRILANGDVGIGTTSPTQKLHVVGVGSFGTSTSQTLVDYDGLNAVGNTDYIRFKVDNSEKLRIKSNGNVGIGTTSPSEKLHIEASDPRIKIVDTDGTNWESEVFTQGGALKLQARNGTNFGNISFQGDNGTTQSEYARFNSVGNFGIGTTSPSEKLEVSGKAIIRKSGSATAHADTDLLVTDATAASSTAAIEILGGNAGHSNIKFADTDSYTSGSIDYNHSSNSMTFRTNNSQNVIINSLGNVGIGTTSPGAKLSVNGNVKIEGTNSLLFGGSASIPSWAINHNGSDLLIDDQGGNIGSVLFNNDEGVALPRLTTTEINAISLPAQGLMAYNTTLNTICFYNGSSWQKVSHTSM